MSSEASWSSLGMGEGKTRLRVWSKGSENLQQVFCGAIAVDYTVYNFAIADGDQNRWYIQKRYSQFDVLDMALNKRFPDVMINIQRLPPKKFVGSLSPSLIAVRQKSLDAYMQALLSKPILAASDEVRDFVEMPLDVRGIDSEERRHHLAAQDALK